MNLTDIKYKISTILEGNSSKTLFINFISLLTLQGLNVILPFLTIPYLIKTVGLELFGLITFSYTVAYFFQIIVEYGFNTVTSREISIHSENSTKINQIFSDVFITKILLLLFLSFIYIGLILLIPNFSKHYNLYLIQFGCVIGQTLFPIWLFHGLQKMKYITYINVFFKTLFTLAIFVLVKSPEDYWIAPLCTALGIINSGIASLFIVHYQFKIKLVKTSVKRIITQLKSSFYVFLSEIQIAAISNGNILILGFFAGNEAVGIFTSAEKIVRAIGNLQVPLINTLFPYISKEMRQNKTKTLKLLKNLKKYISISLLIIIILLFFNANNIFKILYGKGFDDSILVFKIIVIFPLLSFLDQLYGKLILLTNNEEKNFMNVFLSSSILSIPLSIILSYYFSYIGLSISIIIVQLFIVFGMYKYSKNIIKSV